MANEFSDFLQNFLGVLADDNFYAGKSLTAYLDSPSSDRTGDEANIVDDKVASVLITALGYGSGEREYNLAHIGGKRTDFTVRIVEYPRPCFVVESKNTATKQLEKHLPQLTDYMRSQGASRGLLIDGKRLLAYEHAGGAPVSDMSIVELVKRWRGESLFSAGKTGEDALDYADKVDLQAFWQRFRREAYSGLPVLIDNLTLTKSGAPHALDGSTWPDDSRITIHKPDEEEFVETLIAESRDVLAEIQYDVAAQLRLRLTDYETYKHELDEHPNGKTTFSKEFKHLTDNLDRLLQACRVETDDRTGVRSRLNAQFYGTYDSKVFAQLKRNLQKILKGISETTSKEKDGKKKKNSLADQEKRIGEAIDSIQALIRSYHARRKALSKPYEQSLKVQALFELWREKVATLLLRTENQMKLIKEFSAQTAYVLFVRLLMVRIVEDKGLMKRVFTNGGIAHWFETIENHYLPYAQGRSTDYLLDMAYNSAQHIYAHYYSENLIYDWYQPDRNLVIKLLHRLAGYDLSRIDRDVIGHIYGGYVEEEHKHESGMYYTPQEVIEYILDEIGYKGGAVAGRKILDPSSGSGAFLVAACRRQLDAHREYLAQSGRTFHDLSAEDIQGILDGIKNSLYGLELNPFACYLAETNLLIQVLDLFKIARDKGFDAHIDRFHIYNTDTLRYEPETLHILESNLPFSPEELDPEEQIKSKRGTFDWGFDFVVGNPPYVRADEGGEGLLQYREQIKREHPIPDVKTVLAKKWDLFVPFVALGRYLLTDGGRLGMITSNAIEQVAYAQNIREYLTQNAQIDEVSFFPGLYLFEDATVHNTVFFLTNSPLEPGHKVLRKWHKEKPGQVVREEPISQEKYGEDIFRQNIATESYQDIELLGRICYISVGMVLNSDDKRYLGEFTKEDLISKERDETHPLSYIEGDSIDAYELSHLKFLEYGPGLRAPSKIRRPTFPELYDRPKIMRGETSHAWLDNGGTIDNGWIYEKGS